MYFRILLLFILSSFSLATNGQTNITLSTQQATNILTGNYNPATYASSNPITAYDQVMCELNNLVSPDSLKSYLEVLGTFHTRHTFSDTTSPDSGIGAARRWALGKFQEFSNRNENRLQPAYLSFDYMNTSCGDGFDLKNILGILPGADINNKAILVVEAHMDSRCEDRCDINCFAPGIEDNGSGTALVLELARVMSRYTFDQTIVFMLTVGEEQGLLGGEALAEYCVLNNIPLEAVQNNDVIGGVICGDEASPPGCPSKDNIDSLNVRLFSSSSLSGPFRTFARSIKIFYNEKLRNNVKVPMTVNVMSSEDRGGRGGDHIPFRERGFRNTRFTAANEHGDGTPQPGSLDRQHTTRDILGVDTDNNNVLDSFYVDFNYLARNTVINGTSLIMLAAGPETPDFILHDEPAGLRVEITTQTNLPEFRVGIRENQSDDFDAVYRTSSTSFLIPGQNMGVNYYVSVAGINSKQVMSPFSSEQRAISDANTASGTTDNFPFGVNCNIISLPEPLLASQKVKAYLHPVWPNPFSVKTEFSVRLNPSHSYEEGYVQITDISGKMLSSISLDLSQETQKVSYDHNAGSGMFFYSLVLDGVVYTTRKMIAE